MGYQATLSQKGKGKLENGDNFVRIDKRWQMWGTLVRKGIVRCFPTQLMGGKGAEKGSK